VLRGKSVHRGLGVVVPKRTLCSAVQTDKLACVHACLNAVCPQSQKTSKRNGNDSDATTDVVYMGVTSYV
jgi:hypothetical protein